MLRSDCLFLFVSPELGLFDSIFPKAFPFVTVQWIGPKPTVARASLESCTVERLVLV